MNSVMAKFEVPEQVLDKLKCGLCFEYLSHPPITLYAESGSVCGRCPTLDPEKNIQPLREQTYESCANLLFLTFPCRYRSQGCLEKFTMKQMPLHEPSCSFRPYFCPILPLGSCMWQGAPSELHGHFAMTHQIMLLENPIFELDLINNYKEHYLIPMVGQLFLLRTEYDSDQKEFCCSVHLVGAKEQAGKYQYEILISSSENGDAHTLVKKQVELDVNILERITYSTFTLEVIQSKFYDSSNIICKVKIISLFESMIEPVPLQDREEEDDDDNDSEEEQWDDSEKKAMSLIPDPANKMLFDIECPVCQEFMVPPIYQCIIGHSICAVCKPQLKECPTCREKMGNTRNFTLEKITENLDYNCRNRFEGCEVVTNSVSIRKHEVECIFKPHKCPFEIEDCKWSGHLERIMPHCKMQHSAKIQKDAIITMDYSIDTSCDEFKSIMQMFGKLFLLRFSYSNDNKDVYCVVQCYSSTTEAAKYMYEVQMIDLNNTKIQLSSKKYCCSIYDDAEDMKFCTKWDIDMVNQFMLPDEIKCKCVIQRV